MDLDTDEMLPMDVLAYISEDLQGRLKTPANTNKEKVFHDYLDRLILSNDPSLEKVKQMHVEFEKDLDWLNVNEPLSIKALRGKLVVLDFFTYCCINCMHVLPELHALEEKFPIDAGLVVVGVHSPKFANEKNNENLNAAAQRYNIAHPIVNDPRSTLWRSIGIRCWPTLLVLSPDGQPLLLLMGEGHASFLESFVNVALNFFERCQKLNHESLTLQKTSLKPASKLRFPAKIARSSNGRLAIADAGNNRILIIDQEGSVLFKVGGFEPGFIDGNLESARFNSPQGVTFLHEDVLIVADTENHALRQVHLGKSLVETLAGTGHQGNDRVGGRAGHLQAISSPWDVAVFRTRDMDMSFHLDEQIVPEKTIILISMAGTHQIWAYFPEGIIWWKFRKFEPKCCVALIGNGLEENRNNSYPQNAAFAQPSGLAMAKDFLFIADSESSSIRKASMVDGKVLPVVGGDRNPQNLFAFGDVDGKQYNSKLQHPLAVTYNHKDDKVYVADTYNHKIKVIDPITNCITTLNIKDENGGLVRFNEPAGICFNDDCTKMMVADTNNNEIQQVDLETLVSKPFILNFNQSSNTTEIDAPQAVKTLIKKMPLFQKEHLNLNFSIHLADDLKFTESAPQKWNLQSLNRALFTNQNSGELNDGKFSLHLERLTEKVSYGPDGVKINVALSLCDKKCCLMKRFSLLLQNEDTTSQTINNSTVSEKNDDIHIKLNIDQTKISLQ